MTEIGNIGITDNQGGIDAQDISETKVPEAGITSTKSDLLSEISDYKKGDSRHGQHLREELGNKYIEMLDSIKENPNSPKGLELLRKTSMTLVDYEYARQYWIENREQIPFGKFTLMMKHIARSVQKGEIHFFVSLNGFEEDDKKIIGAYRTLARQMGYAIGNATHKKDIVTIPIKFIQF